MAVLNTTAIAHDLMGPSMRLYHQVLVTHANQPRLKIDKAGAGDFGFIDSAVPGSDPEYDFRPDGLYFAYTRPASQNGSKGIFAYVNFSNVPSAIPDRFLMTASFAAPTQKALSPQWVNGNYAAAILINFTDDLAGAGLSAQLRANGMRINFPGTNAGIQKNNIDNIYYNEVMDPQDPATFTLVLYVNRKVNTSMGDAAIYVNDQKADDCSFEFKNGLTKSTVIQDIGVGLGTASGSDYRVSVRLLEFEIWTPTANH